MIKILAIGGYFFLLTALIFGIWGELERIRGILDRGMWQYDQYLKRMCGLIVDNTDAFIGKKEEKERDSKMKL
jgi:hypothetical protein